MKKLILFALLFAIYSKSKAQSDYAFGAKPIGFKWDSLTILVSHMHTQDSLQDKDGDIRNYVKTYFFIKNDSLFSNFPETYKCYEVHNPLLGIVDSNKIMISIERRLLKNETETTHIPKNIIIGRKNKFICKTKQTAIIYLSL